MSATRAVVIGAGLGGLAAAIRLLADGFDVTVLEQQPTPGGRAGQIVEAGFTFDTGPSLITMPALLDDLFGKAGTSLGRELHLTALDPFYRIAWEGDDRSFLFSGDASAMRQQIAGFDAQDSERYGAFLHATRRLYEDAILVAGRKNFVRFNDFLRLVPSMARLGGLNSVHRFVGRFFREPHVRQAFDFHPLFIGGSPFRVPAIYAALAYLQIAEGVWYADGGVYALVEALARQVRRGATLRTSCGVRRIIHNGRRVSGIETQQGEHITADVVVSNADVGMTQRLLARRTPRSRLTMSCYLLYLGTRRPFPRLHHHTLLVGRDYAGFINGATVSGAIADSLCLYVHAPSRTDPGMAPADGESISVLVPVPNLTHGADWKREGPALRNRVIDALEQPSGLGLEGLSDSIVVEREWSPFDFRDRLGADAGNAFGPEPTLLQSAYFRQPNRDRRLQGMYYVGAGTHPGAGIPGVLLGAEVTTDLIRRDMRPV